MDDFMGGLSHLIGVGNDFYLIRVLIASGGVLIQGRRVMCGHMSICYNRRDSFS